MPDVRCGDTVRGQQRRLEGKDAQHMVGGAADFFYPFRAPGPDAGADEMHRLDALCAQAALQLQVEIGRVHTDEKLRWLRQQPGLQRLADAQDFAQAP